MTALYAAALDTRLKVALSSGYLDDSRPDWEQPEDRMLWKLRANFSNDQIGALVAPRKLRISHAIDAAALAWLAQEQHPNPPAPLPANAPTPSLDLEKVSQIATAHFSEWQ